MPPFWALAIMLVLKAVWLHLPSWIREILTPVHMTMTPLASLVLGLSINCSAVRLTLALTGLGVAVRMFGGLLLGWIAAWR